MMSKIEQIINELEDYIDHCKLQPFSKNNIIVSRDDIDELISELRLRTPEEIKKYQKIINNKDAILNDAKQKAENIIAQAGAQANEMVNENEIMQQAYAQANDMMQQASEEAQQLLDNAVADANAIRSAAVQYTDDELANLERVITHTMENVALKFDNFMKSMNDSLEIVRANRAQLFPADEAAQGDDESEQSELNIADENVDTTEFEDYTVNLDDEEF